MSSAPARAARAPVLIAAAIALAYLVIAPASADLAAQEYRVGLVRDHGFTVWDGGWYGGHHTPGYSVLFPPLGALLTARVAGALAVVAAAALFALLADRRWGERARLGAAWFGVGVAAWLFTGRLTFLLGVALGLAALLAAQRRRPGLAVLFAVLTGLGSPVAALFVALAGTAWAVAGARAEGSRGDRTGSEEGALGDHAGDRTGGETARGGRAAVFYGLALAVAALAPVLALAVAFPEGGVDPFQLRYLVPPLLLAVGGVALLAPEERVLRTGLVLYALAAIAAAAIETPVGVNVTRLGALFGGPVLACALAGRRPRALAVIALPLAYWQLHPPVRDTLLAAGEPSTGAAYHRPLVAELRRLGGPPGRLEIPPLREHGEARFVARHVPLARGWELQLDLEHDRLFHDGPLTPATYRAWLDDNAVRWVALADAPLDRAAKAEAALIRRGLPYLRPVWGNEHWRLYAVRAPGALVRGAGRAVAVGNADVSLDAARAGPLDVRVRPSPYWALTQGSGCVERGPRGWMRVDVRRPGRLRLAIRLSPRRVIERGPRCHGR